PTDDPIDRADRELDSLVPDAATKPYDMLDVLRRVVDDGEFLQVHEGWAQNIICAFARLDGKSIGVVAQQPTVLAGVLDIDTATSSRKRRIPTHGASSSSRSTSSDSRTRTSPRRATTSTTSSSRARPGSA